MPLDLTHYHMVMYVKAPVAPAGDGWVLYGRVPMSSPEAGERMVRLQTTAVREYGVSTGSGTLKWEMSARYV